MKKPDLLKLRPTQFVLGMKEVEFKIKKMKGFSKKQKEQFAREHVVPVVKGWDQEYYMIDHHHFVRACWEAGNDNYEIKVIKDFSKESEKSFWKKMIKSNWTYLHDQFGKGPHSPLDLPLDIRCLADDPFRSLAWIAIDACVVKKSSVPFFEFAWASYFRKNLNCRLHSKSDFKNATARAVKLALRKKAAHLPGFVGAKSIDVIKR